MSAALINRLFYLAIVLVVLLGALVAYLDDEAVTRTAAGPFMLLLAAICGLCAQEAVATGRFRPRRLTVYRNKSPIVFWSNVGFLYLAAATLFAAALWHA